MTGTMFFGFDVERTSELSRRLRASADASARMTSAIRRIVDEGNALAGSSFGTRLHSVGAFLHLVETETSGLERISHDAPHMADEIDRRLVQLVSCRSMINANFVIDPGDIFLDEAPADPAKVSAVLDRFRTALTKNPGEDGNTDELLAMTAELTPLTHTELDAFIARLTDAELAQWNTMITKKSVIKSHSDWFGEQIDVEQNGLRNEARMALANLLLTASSSTVRRIAVQVPSVHPPGFGNLQLATGDLFRDGADLHDASQGVLGDCWFVAALEAVASKDPGFIERHIAKNANGTYTVTLFRHGEPYPVTVTGDLAQDANGRLVYSGDLDQSPSGELWVAIYEKAFAQYHGSYPSIESGLGDWALPVITGQKADRGLIGKYAPFTTLGDLAKELDRGRAVTLGSKPFELGSFAPGKHILTKHVYTVQSIDMHAHPHTITVVNPWGIHGNADYIVTLTEAEWDNAFVGYSVGHMP